MKRLFLTFPIVLLLLATVAPARADVTPTVVTAASGTGDQVSPAVDDATIMWARSRSSDESQYDLMAKVGTGTAFKVNPAGTQAFTGSVSGTTAIYQQVTNGTDSDLRMYDFTTGTSSAPPVGVNSAKWEWSPSTADGYILYGRNAFSTPSSLWQVLLFNTATGTKVTLDQAKNSCACIFPGQIMDVGGTAVATWTKCLTTCEAFYQKVTSTSKTKIANPLAKDQYFPSPSPDGTFYLVRGGTGCGHGITVMRFNPAVSSNQFTTIAAVPAGSDVSTRTWVDVDAGAHTDVYFDQLVCSHGYNADIYLIDNADLVPSAAAVTRSSAMRSNGGAARLSTPAAGPS